jgi:hypothetical protein
VAEDESVHIDVPLTDISVAYQGAARSFIADKIFPQVPVGGRNSYYDGSYPAPPRRQPRLERIPMEDIELDDRHVALDQDLVAAHLMVLAAGGELEPVEVDEWSISDDDWAESRGGYTLRKGREAYAASLIAGRREIWATVLP